MEAGMMLGREENVWVISCKECAHQGNCPFEEMWLTLGVDDGYCRFGVAKDDANNPKKPEV